MPRGSSPIEVYKNVAVIARPGADTRRAEVLDAEKTVESLGYSLNRIRPPATLDGGDVLKVGSTVYVGLGCVTCLSVRLRSRTPSDREAAP